jgi:hypothetical protein
MGRSTMRGPVIYIAGEGGEEGVAHRVRAALSEWTVDVDGGDNVPFHIITPGLDFVEGGGLFADLVGLYPPENPALVVVDTLSRCFSGDENKQEFMGKFVSTLDHLREHYRCDILIIHHANKQRELRGSSVLFGAVDVSWALRPYNNSNEEGKGLSIRADKLRERPSEDAQFTFRALPKKLVGPHGRPIIDEFGDEQTTLVIKPFKAHLEEVRRIVEEGLKLIGMKGGAAITYLEWREEADMKKSEFDNALSFVVTFPGKWGIMRGVAPGTYIKAVPGIDNHWSSLV